MIKDATSGHEIQPETINRLQTSVPPAFALLAGMKLELFSAIGDDALRSSEIAARIGVDQSRLERLLFALVTTGLLELDAGLFRNSKEAAAFLVKGRPRFIGDEHELLGELWAADLQTAASIRMGQPAARHDFSQGSDEASAAFLRGLVPSSLAFGRDISRQFDLSGCKSVIDIGGGPGTTLLGIRERFPHLELTLFELPSTLSLARQILQDLGAIDTIAFEAGDITAEPSKKLHDVVILKAVIQVLSRGDAMMALKNAAASLRSGGTAIISGAGILDDNRLSPFAGVFYNLTFMNLYPEGASYTEQEYRDWCAEAGLKDMRRTAVQSGSIVLSATKA